MWQVKYEGDILVLQTLAITKVVYFSLEKDVPYKAIVQLDKNRNLSGEKVFLNWNRLLSLMTMKKTDLEKEVILSKVINLKCMRIKVLCDSDFSYLEGNNLYI